MNMMFILIPVKYALVCHVPQVSWPAQHTYMCLDYVCFQAACTDYYKANNQIKIYFYSQ